MASQKQRFYIYDRREMVILSFLGVMIALFAFTLGIHLGKQQQVALKNEQKEGVSVKAVDTVDDQIPGNMEFQEQRKKVSQAEVESMNQELQTEVAEMGIKLDQSRQTELPKQTVNRKAGSTTLNAGVPKIAKDAKSLMDRTAPQGKYTIQVGSFATMKEAMDKAKQMESEGLTPFIRKASIEGKGERYRIFFGGFESKQAAELYGNQYVTKKMIEAFFVAKMP